MKLNCVSSLLAVAVTGALFVSPPNASAQPVFGLRSLTGSIGLANPEVLGSTFHLAVRTDYMTLAPNVTLDAGLHYWQKSYSFDGLYGDYYGTDDDSFYGARPQFATFPGTSSSESKWTYRDVALSSGVKYDFPMASSSVVPYVRGGLGLHFESASYGGASIGATKAGVYVGGGANFRMGKALSLGGDLSYHIAGTDHLLLGVQLSYALGM